VRHFVGGLPYRAEEIVWQSDLDGGHLSVLDVDPITRHSSCRTDSVSSGCQAPLASAAAAANVAPTCGFPTTFHTTSA
jgi:hypothetical protein